MGRKPMDDLKIAGPSPKPSPKIQSRFGPGTIGRAMQVLTVPRTIQPPLHLQYKRDLKKQIRQLLRQELADPVGQHQPGNYPNLSSDRK